MDVIIYGPDKPKINFKQTPDGSINFSFENETIVYFKEGKDTITWCDLFTNGVIGDCSAMFDSKEDATQTFQKEIDKFVKMTGTDAEAQFLRRYIQEWNVALEIGIVSSPWNLPALIPQVWVNWLHYDSKDTARAERAQNEPFRVDFMLKDGEISPNFIIFEIDGLSHFKDMQTYTQHLRKDRWLRKQGWQVYRISNYEVENCDDFHALFYELTGRYIGIPF